MNAKLIFAGAGLFLSGAGVGAFVANKYLERKWMQAAEQEIRYSMKDFYEKKSAALAADANKTLDGLNSGLTVIVNASDDAKEFVEEVIRKQGYIENEIKKSEIDIFKDPEEDGEEPEFPDEYIHVEEVDRDCEPQIISFDEFNDTCDNYDKITLCYFAGDDTLTGEDEALDPLLYDLVGDDALSSFGEKSEDPDIVYVRNDNAGIDYEIIRLEKSYKEAVLGIHDEPVPVPKRPAKRSKPKTEDI